jgi:hypothetical protein
MNKLAQFSNILSELGTVGFGANLAGGKIHWTNSEDKVVAHADIKAILSWAATNNSAMWAHAIGQFQDANIPVIKPEDAKSEYIGNVTDEQAGEFAATAGLAAGAEYIYRAANGANGLYLAIFNFKAESIELSADDIVRKRRSSIGYIVQMLGNIGEIMSNKKRMEEAQNLLLHFCDALDQQMGHTLRDEDLIAEALKLQKSIRFWVSVLPGQKTDVLAFIKQAASKWHRML